jgi:hypothetical protein
MVQIYYSFEEKKRGPAAGKRNWRFPTWSRTRIFPPSPRWSWAISRAKLDVPQLGTVIAWE